MSASGVPRRGLRIVLVAALSVAAFMPALGGDFVSDDVGLAQAGSGDVALSAQSNFFVVHGVNQGGGLYRHAYRPFVQVMLALQKQAFGAHPLGFHLVNLLLHGLNSLLVLRWLERRLGRSGEDDEARSWAALAGALLFALHPAHAESVAWISGATDLWMTLALLLSFEALQRARWTMHGLGAVALACAVLAKEPAATAPVLLLVDSWAANRARRETVSSCAAATLAVIASVALLYAFSLHAARGTELAPSLNAALALTGEYLRIALLPTHLTFQSQPYVLTEHGIALSSVSIASGALFWLALALIAVNALRNARLRPWLADALWFALPLLPVLILLEDILSDRFLYAPLLGLSALSARALQALLRVERVLLRRAGAALAAIALAASLPASVQASLCFLDAESLWRSQVEIHPEYPKANDALAEELARLGRHAEAAQWFERGLTQALAHQQRKSALHFAEHLLVLPATSRPDWDVASMTEVCTHCRELAAGRLPVKLPGRTLTFPLSAEERRESEDVSLILLPCAKACLAAQDTRTALDFAQRARALQASEPAVLELNALALARSGQFERALASIAQQGELANLSRRIGAARDASAEAAKSDARSAALLGAQVAMLLGSPEGARRALAAQLDASPRDHELVHALAQSYVSERRFDEATWALERARGIDAQDPYWTQALAALAAARSQANAR